LQYLTAFKTCFIYSLSPFLAALLSYFVFSEALSPKKWLGLFIGIAGISPVLIAQSSSEMQAGNFFIFSWPELALIVATLSSAYGWILLKQLVQENNFTPIMANGLSMLIGGVMALIHSGFVENWDPLPVTEFLPYFECAIALLVISNLICYNLYGSLLKRFSATFMSFAGFTTPVFTAILGWIFLGETITWLSVFSGIVVFFGLTVFYQDELNYVPKPAAVVSK
jgi:drug/metabolite transporter (DMT)-like permease